MEETTEQAIAAPLEISIDDLARYLPAKLSFSQQSIPTSSGTIQILRRHVFDARFQIISQNLIDEDSTWNWKEGFPADQGSESDLVKGVYEGGMKTWEASSDLTAYIASKDLNMSATLELGCGTALPSLYVFRNALASIPDRPPAKLHLQDYNPPVLAMLTFPNLLLNYVAIRHPDRVENSGELELDDEIVDGFMHEIANGRHVNVRFFAGAWGPSLSAILSIYTLCLTSETIYNKTDIAPLLKVMQDAKAPCTLVAAKKVYFGVGGSVEDLMIAARQHGTVEQVWTLDSGVGRVILQIHWGRS